MVSPADRPSAPNSSGKASHEEAHQLPRHRGDRRAGRHGRRPSFARGGHREQGHRPGRRPDARAKWAWCPGGGSGHEPLHGGFVGYGMLDAACAGEVFTSPVPDQMLVATKAVNGGAGVLHIVKNYTGDVLNFQMAAELAEDEGIEVAPVVVNDDVAVQDSLYTAGPPRRPARPSSWRRSPGRWPSAAPRWPTSRRSRCRGQRAQQVLRRRADLLHGPRGRQAHLRARRAGDRARHRHPRRAWPHPGAAATAQRRSPRSAWTRSTPTCR